MNGNSCLLFRGLQEACLNWGKPGRHSEIYARMTNSEGHVSKERDRQTDRQTEHHPHAPKKKKKSPLSPILTLKYLGSEYMTFIFCQKPRLLQLFFVLTRDYPIDRYI